MIFETVLLPIGKRVDERGYRTTRPDSGSGLIPSESNPQISIVTGWVDRTDWLNYQPATPIPDASVEKAYGPRRRGYARDRGDGQEILHPLNRTSQR